MVSLNERRKIERAKLRQQAEEAKIASIDSYETESSILTHDKVSIVVLVKDALKYLKLCLESIVNYTSNYELIIVDNGSNITTKKYLTEKQKELGFKLITNKKNMGFSYGNNQAIKVSTCDYICFLNSDCVVTKNWLGKLMDGFNYPNAGIIGPSSCWTNGKQCISRLADKRETMTIDDINAIKLEPAVIETELMGFCYLVSKKVIEKIGVFDYNRYELGLSEEIDFNWRARQAGFKLYWIKDVYIHHWGNKTWEVIGINPYNLLSKNRAILADRIKNDSNIFIDNDSIIPSSTKSNKIDVIIPVLDRPDETTKTLKALLRNNKDINVIIVDNGSSDINYLNNFDVEIITNNENIGVVNALNKGLTIAKSKYIVIMHNDIVVNTENWIAKAIKFMENDDKAGMIGIAGWKELDKNGEYLTKKLVTAIDKYKQKPKGEFEEVAILDGCCNVIRNINLKYDKSFGLMHFYDLDMSMQYKTKGYNLYVINGSAIHIAEDRKISTIQNIKYKELIGKKDTDYYWERRDIFVSKWARHLPIGMAPIPIKMITWNRLEYTKKAIKSVLDNTDHPFILWIWDNNSTDGTVEYLKSLKDDRIMVNFSKENLGLVPPFNIFLDKFKDVKYVAQLDNDCIVSKGWLNKFKSVMDNFPLFVISGDHYLGIPYRIKHNREFYDHLETLNFEGDKIYLYSHAGMGNMVRRKWLDRPVEVTEGELGGWVRYQHEKWWFEGKTCAFHSGVWIELQDMTATNTPKYDYPGYRAKTNVMRSGNENDSGFGTKDLDLKELEVVRGRVVERWEKQLSQSIQ